MNEQEQLDLDEMKEAVDRKKRSFFDMCRTISTSTPEQLNHMGVGGRTKGEAMESFFKMYAKDIEKLIRDYERKYPD